MRKFALLALFAAPALADTQTISLHDKQFEPGEISIARGTTLQFKNDDAITHNVMARDGETDFDLGLQKPGETKQQVFAKPGRFTVGCDLHPRMMLTVTVK